MQKSRTVGVIGERYIKSILTKNEIDFYDMSKNKTKVTVKIPACNNSPSCSYETEISTHPFDLKIGKKNFEIKTSKLNSQGHFCCNLTKNNKKLIDYVILVIISDYKIPQFFYLFNKKFLKNYKAINLHYDNDKIRKLDKKELILAIKQAVDN